MTTAAVILAAGGGTRFTGDSHKLLTKVRKRTLVGWAVRHALAAQLDETIVVSGAVDLADEVPDDVTLLHNHDWAQGQAHSLRVAIRWAQMAGHLAVVVGVGDQPLVPPSAWLQVAETDATPIAAATFRGHRAPPTRLSEDVWPMLPIGGDEAARSIIRQRPDLVTEVPCEGRALDVDTLGDLGRIEPFMLSEGVASWT